MSFLEQPIELILEQIKDLPIPDLGSLAQVNRQLARLINSDQLWNYRVSKDYQVENEIKPRKCYKKRFIRQANINKLLDFIISGFDYTSLSESLYTFRNHQLRQLHQSTDEQLTELLILKKLTEDLKYTDRREGHYYQTIGFYLESSNIELILAKEY